MLFTQRSYLLKGKSVVWIKKIIIKKLVKIGIIKTNSDHSGINNYKKNIWRENKIKKTKLDTTERKEQNRDNDLFKKYKNPSNMHKELNKTENTEKNQIKVNLIKTSLIDLKKRHWKYI